jgi:hypothetical protein
VAVGCVELVDEARNEVLVLQRLLDSGQCWACLLALPGVPTVSIRLVVVAALLVLNLLPQTLQVEVAQCIWTQPAALVVFVARNVGVPLQQVRDAAEDSGADAIGMQALEQQ